MLRRYKASSLLNIVGLTLAFTAFYIILVQVRWELTYNRSIPDADRIYLVELQSWYEPGSWQSWINRPVSERVIASASGVEAGGCSWGGFGSGLVWRQNASRMGYDKFAVSAGAISVPLLERLLVPLRRGRRARHGPFRQRHRLPPDGRTAGRPRGRHALGRYRESLAGERPGDRGRLRGFSRQFAARGVRGRLRSGRQVSRTIRRNGVSTISSSCAPGPIPGSSSPSGTGCAAK